MVARVGTVAFQGVEVLDVDVQVQVARGVPAFRIVGLPDKAVAESRERVRAALSAMGLALPAKRITVNLSPADLLKEGSHFDLPIALGLLTAMDVMPPDTMDSHAALGELALDGAIAPVAGALPAAIHAAADGRGLVCPAPCGGEAAWAGDVDIVAAPSLLAFVNHVKGTQVLRRPKPVAADDAAAIPDLRDIKGQEIAKRALEVVAAGGHNLLMCGPPGAGTAREIQRSRFANLSAGAIRTNAGMDGELLERVAAPDASGARLLAEAAERLRLTARGYHRALRFARTLADLNGADGVRRLHVAEALSYRRIAGFA